MNSKKISNPKIEVPKGLQLNDKDYITSLLSCLKELEKNYTVCLTEASNEYLYNKYLNMFNNISSMQRSVYELMFKKGWYCIDEAPQSKITEKLTMLSQEYEDLELKKE
ncbi:MAG: spore coat protein [bacterium]|nr:spore coat protein [bacterium]